MINVRTDPVTAWAWLWVASWAILGWIPVDLWLHRNHHPYLTTQMRIWMHDPRYGWAIWGAFVALPVMLLMHLLIVGPKQ